MENNKETNLVWLDLEMTGLNLEEDRITEIACLVTDENLEVIEEGPEIIINQPEELFDRSDPFLVETFIDSGFVDKMKESEYSEVEAEDEILSFIKKHVSKNKSPLCGNSVYMDRMFINRYMKKLDDFLHYRLIDVSTLKNLALRWYPDLPEFEKSETHRAMDDIKESIEELKYYREHILVSN